MKKNKLWKQGLLKLNQNLPSNPTSQFQNLFVQTVLQNIWFEKIPFVETLLPLSLTCRESFTYRWNFSVKFLLCRAWTWSRSCSRDGKPTGDRYRGNSYQLPHFSFSHIASFLKSLHTAHFPVPRKDVLIWGASLKIFLTIIIRLFAKVVIFFQLWKIVKTV